LVDPLALALGLPWKRDADNGLATQAEISAAWHALKARPDLAKRHTRHARALTQLHLDDADIDTLVEHKLAANDRFIERWFPGWENIPADAQLAIHSMAWAAGPGFNQKFPLFTEAALRGDWQSARAHCELRAVSPEGIPNHGVIPRNKANQLCFANAALVIQCGGQPDILHWPDVFTVPAVHEDDGAELRALAYAAKEQAADEIAALRRREAHRELSELPDPNALQDPDDGESTLPDAGRV
jgi:hypothetical protein